MLWGSECRLKICKVCETILWLYLGKKAYNDINPAYIKLGYTGFFLAWVLYYSYITQYAKAGSE